MNKKKNNKGFSLIELIIAIAILIILTGLLAPQFMKYIEKSREAKDMQTLDTVYTVMQGALADEKAYTDFVAQTSGDSGKLKDIDKGMKFESLLADASACDYTKEIKNLLGTSSNVKLTSKKAGANAVVCVQVIYKPAGDAADLATADTLAITVYAGDKDAKPIKGLDVVGAPYTTTP
ncbi:prepilin-type N-terminal cleavage/methylation domain-containing protein [[Clostridium] symbiosum]|uniref:prepilin-type N-terminal cleavage/methylation domain-containing protein n=1 Tax=Clostridium symbiosum TaxID=1512 RepID=UPI001D07E0C2|nr:prepilin-type N-terminal cleavage/methylation domain-containing protein [[Clostridium] symbiosum]MCB6610334.1 prepilin-type N-terminal cleavage/methylation domain-containing protein [[Clostridium] symbiosum]MCB6932002.1 prepilin-type N-terminal cleavage/methylation domain-containing protein [[Clostridium] symbiosum]